MSKSMILLGIYGFRNFCRVKQSFSIAEILMPKLDEHVSNLTFTLLDETLSGKSDEFLSQGRKFRPIRYYVIKWPNVTLFNIFYPYKAQVPLFVWR